MTKFDRKEQWSQGSEIDGDGNDKFVDEAAVVADKPWNRYCN